jgi:dihydrofolate reductase
VLYEFNRYCIRRLTFIIKNNIRKIVFSNTLKQTVWNNAIIAEGDLREEITQLKQQQGGDIFVGSPGLIVQCTQHNLIDEYQICVQPIIIGKGLPLFKSISDRIDLRLINTKTFGSGSIVLYYERVKE